MYLLFSYKVYTALYILPTTGQHQINHTYSYSRKMVDLRSKSFSVVVMWHEVYIDLGYGTNTNYTLNKFTTIRPGLLCCWSINTIRNSNSDLADLWSLISDWPVAGQNSAKPTRKCNMDHPSALHVGFIIEDWKVNIFISFSTGTQSTTRFCPLLLNLFVLLALCLVCLSYPARLHGVALSTLLTAYVSTFFMPLYIRWWWCFLTQHGQCWVCWMSTGRNNTHNTRLEYA